MESFKVSILVPVYGVRDFIRQCAISLFSQTYSNIEYVFVDDCTPDDSIAILQEVLRDYPARTDQVKIIRHGENQGLGAGRKTAFAAATGDFVLNVDSDDYLLPNAVELLVKEQQRVGADIVTGSFFNLYSNGNMTEAHCVIVDKSRTLKLLLIQHTIPHTIWARLIRKDIYVDHGIDSIEGINMAEDYGLVVRLFHAADHIAFVEAPVYVYRLGSAASTFGRLKGHHMVSFLKANETVRQYIMSHAGCREYAFALETGMLNVYHLAMKAGLTCEQIQEICHYAPRILLFRLCHSLFAHRFSLPLLRFSYLCIKWCYKRKLHYRG